MRELDSIKSVKEAPSKYADVKGDIITGELQFKNGGKTTIYNPTNNTATFHFDYLNNVPRIRYGGSGDGAQNGFEIQGTGDSVKFKIDNNGELYAAGTRKVYHTGNKPTPNEIGAQPKESTTFIQQTDYVAVRTETRKAGQYYEFWDTDRSWADIRCGELYANGYNKVYHTANKPTWNDIQSKPSTFAPSSHNHDSSYASKTNGFDIELSKVTWSNLDISSKTAFAYSSSSASGKPTGQDHALMQMAYSDLWKTQLAHDWRTNKVYIRSKNNGSWINWAELYSTLSKPSPADIGALGKTEKAASASNSDKVNGREFKWEFGTGNPTHIWGSSGSSTTMQVWAPNNITVGRATSAGSADSVAWANISGKPGTYSPSSHTHDDRYFTESEINGMITEAATASKLVKRDSAGDINCRLLRPNYANQSTISGAIAYRVNNSTDNYVRFCSDTTAIRNWIGAAASNHSHSLPTAAQLGAMKMTRTGSSAGDYYIMGDIYGSDDSWLRTTQPGLLPHSPGTSRLGDIGERFHTIYGINGNFDNIKVNGTTGQILMNGSYADSGDLCLGWDNKVISRISISKGTVSNTYSDRWLKIAVADENDKEDVLLFLNAEASNWITHSASLCALNDNSRSLGSANFRYTKVFSAGGVVTSSDEKMKHHIKYIDKTPKATRSKRNAVNLMTINSEEDIDNFEINTNDCYNFIKDTPYATYFYKKKVDPGASTKECEEADKNDTVLMPSSEDFMVGFIAQDIAKSKVGRMFLDHYDETGYNYNLNNYVGVIAKALQEAMIKIEALESQLEIKKR